jgi:DNA replication protein DnaC
MDQSLQDQLDYLKLHHIAQSWEALTKEATRTKPSYHRFLCGVVAAEYAHQLDQRRLARIRRAKIPELLVMETFPFSRQPNVDKRIVLDNYDSTYFMTQSQVLLFIGPTGCGKTGLATAFLIHAINNNHRGRFIDFKDLAAMLNESQADHSDRQIIKQLSSYDCLLIDEMGYAPFDKQLAGLFFDLFKQRHRKHCTIITTQLGFEEWGKLLGNEHLSAALIDRITENCFVCNMDSCISLRPKNISIATKAKSSSNTKK